MFLKKSFSIFLLFLVLFSFVLSGCRNKTPEDKGADYSGIELTYYKVFDGSDVIEPLISKYEADHPGLKINYKMFSDFSEYESAIINEMAEGEGPDIFSMQNTWFVSNYKKIAPFPKDLGTPADFSETFVDVASSDLVRTNSDGVLNIYGLPMTVDNLALYYNKSHFEDRIPTKGKPSTTWEGIKEDVMLLNKIDNSFDRFEVSGIALGRADNISRAVDILYMLFLQYGVDFYNDNISQSAIASRKGSSTLDYPAQEALKLFASFSDSAQKHYSWNEFVVDDDSDSMEIEAFARGDVSMIIGYAYTYDLILKEIEKLKNENQSVINKSVIKVAPIPQLYDPDISNDKRVTYASYFAETVSRNCEHPDLAWDFLIFLTNKENLEYYFKETHKPTSRRDLIEAQKKDPIYGVFASQVGFAESFPILNYYRFKEIFTELINNVSRGLDYYDSGILKAQDLINDMLPEEGVLVPEAELSKQDLESDE
jgi:ABC-type glycerol-3-phosphate transport system substrate-binding protein